MATVKIDALPAAATPLDGTEVLPIVKAGVTDQVSVANLTAGRAVSASGLTVTGLTASQAVLTDGSKALVSVATTGSGDVVRATSPSLITPNLGTPSAATLTNATGLPLTTGVTGTLPVANGGTGATTSTGSGAVVLASSPTLTTPNLGTPSAATLTNATGLPLSTGVTGTLPVANGGTGQTSYTDGELLIGNSTGNTLTKATLTAGANVTITNGNGSITIAATGGGGGGSGTVTSVAQTFTGGLISVAGSPITTSGTLALTVAGTSGGIPYFSGASTWASSGALAANALVIGGGAGAAPSTVTTGTGVVTALGVNTGTAGAFVVNGGALGTPSSGTVTNLTGTASININGTVGATTPNTGAFTSVVSTSASGVLNRAAATQDGIALVGRAGGTSSYTVSLTPTTLSANRTVTFPDAATNIPVATQTLTFSGPTAARTITLPDANFTAARTDAANTFTGTQTFGGSVVPASLTVDSVGYTGTPLNEQSAAYTLVAGDAGKSIVHPASDNNARTFTIPANGTVAFPVGTTITFINMINTVTIAITTDTMYLAGAGTTGSRTLAAYGMATAVKMTSTTWIISGNGLT